MSPSNGDAIVLILDVGESVANLYPGETRSFYDKSRDCVSLIIQRKLLSESPDVLSLLVAGCSGCENNLNYEHITCKFIFQSASWDMLRYVESAVVSTKEKTDWVEALVVAMDLLKNYANDASQSINKKIVVFSDFSNCVTDKQMFDRILKNLKNLEVDLTVIGPGGFDLSTDNELPLKKKKPYIQELGNGLSDSRQAGQKMLHSMWQELGDKMSICNFMSAMRQLWAYPRKSKRITAWNAVLDVGNIEILISAFKKTDMTKMEQFSKTMVKNPETDINAPGPSAQMDIGVAQEVVRDRVMHYKHENEMTKEIEEVSVTDEDITEGHCYGATLVPFTDADKAALSYKPGPKGLSIIGFTHKSTTPLCLMTGDAAYVVVARDEDNEEAFSAIVQAMANTDCVAIARRVYRDDCGCKLGVLSPLIEEPFQDDPNSYKECLIFVPIAYNEDVRSVQFPSLSVPIDTVTEDQCAVVDQLIDGMDLMSADIGYDGDPCEALDIPQLHEFSKQFQQYQLVQKALYPDEPPPSKLPDHIRDFITYVETAVEDINQQLGAILAESFTVETNKKNKSVALKAQFDAAAAAAPPPITAGPGLSRKDGRAVSPSNMSDSGISSLAGTITDIADNSVEGDIRSLFFGSRLPSPTALWKVVETHVIDLCGDEVEVWTCMKGQVDEKRRSHVNSNPDDYNHWVTRMKQLTREKMAVGLKLWNVFVQGNFGLITQSESCKSGVSEEAALDFLADSGTQQTPSVITRPPSRRQAFGSMPDVLDSTQAEANEVMNLLF